MSTTRPFSIGVSEVGRRWSVDLKMRGETITYLHVAGNVRVMPSTPTRFLFREPSGRPHAFVMLSGALLFLVLYVYASVLGDSSSSSWLVVMAAGTGLSGIAESLPNERRRTAGILRVTAVLVLMGLLATTVFTPEFIVGEQ
mgnify:CR=1 FL=1